MADTVYDKINLRTGFVAPINRGGWTLMCSDARRVRIPFYKYFLQNFQILVTNLTNVCHKFDPDYGIENLPWAERCLVE